MANAEDTKAEEASTPSIIQETVETDDSEAAVIAAVKEPAVKPARNVDEESNLNFKRNQCDYTHTTEKELGMHKRMKHRISQVDGMNDFVSEDSSEDDKNVVSIIYKIYVKGKKTVKEVEKELTYTIVWDDINLSQVAVKEDMDHFSLKVECLRRDYPEDFTVSWAAGVLKSLPWPKGFLVISSQPLRHLTSHNQ